MEEQPIFSLSLMWKHNSFQNLQIQEINNKPSTGMVQDAVTTEKFGIRVLILRENRESSSMKGIGDRTLRSSKGKGRWLTKQQKGYGLIVVGPWDDRIHTILRHFIECSMTRRLRNATSRSSSSPTRSLL
jgi:hypothetical protein